MILRPRLGHLLLSIYLFTSLTSAWPWPPSFPGLEGILVRREDDPSDSAKATAKAPAKATGAQPTKTGAAATTGKAAASKTKGKEAAKTTKKPQQTEVDERLPPGGVNIISPSTLSVSTFYKIGVDSVSLVWNYTSLSVTPSKIDVLVTCTANQATYTLATNKTFEKTASYVWDTKPEITGQNPLLTEHYTLIIHDSQKAVTDRPDAGHLGAYNQFVFGMYIPQKYTPRSEWKCATCNDALSDTDRQALKFMAVMCSITVLSFTWFVGGFGAFL